MLSYEPLWNTMKNRNITTYTLINTYSINPRTINNLKHNKSITMYTLERLCQILHCKPNDVIEFIDEQAHTGLLPPYRVKLKCSFTLPVGVIIMRFLFSYLLENLNVFRNKYEIPKIQKYNFACILFFLYLIN